MRVLVVDDEKVVADSIALIFQVHGHDTFTAYSAEEALQKLDHHKPDLLIADVMMGGMNGLELARECREAMPGCKVLLISGQSDTSDLLEEARQQGVSFEIVAKPIRPQDLIGKAMQLCSAASTTSPQDLPSIR